MRAKYIYALSLIVIGIGFVTASIVKTETGAVYEEPWIKTDGLLEKPFIGESTAPLKVTPITLHLNNFLVFRGEVYTTAVATAQQKLLQLNAELPKGEPLYIVLDTPGGEIDAGNNLVDVARSLGRPVHTITLFAASMGFSFVQRLDKRYILPNGMLMAHRATSGGVSGQVPGELLTRVLLISQLVERLDRLNASRMQISYEQYTKLVLNEYWVSGADAVKTGAADELAHIICAPDISGTNNETINTPFGPINVVWSNCPAVTYPVSASFGGLPEMLNEAVKFMVKTKGNRYRLQPTTNESFQKE